MSVEIGEIHRGAYFSWCKTGCGFGELSFYEQDGILYCDNEYMSRETVREILHALADHVADQAIMECDRKYGHGEK